MTATRSLSPLYCILGLRPMNHSLAVAYGKAPTSAVAGGQKLSKPRGGLGQDRRGFPHRDWMPHVFCRSLLVHQSPPTLEGVQTLRWCNSICSTSTARLRPNCTASPLNTILLSPLAVLGGIRVSPSHDLKFHQDLPLKERENHANAARLNSTAHRCR